MGKYDGLLMASGGMDSTVMAHWLKRQGKNILPFFIDYGQHCMETELKTLKKLLPDDYVENIRIIDIKDIYYDSTSKTIIEPDLWNEHVEADDLYLPFRNLLFFSIAAITAESENINNVYAAFIDSNLAKEIDCSEDFFTKLDALFALYGTVNIKIPFKNFTKKDVAELGIKLDVPISETFSCQVHSQAHCGSCPNCVDRLNALTNLEYESDLL